MVFICLNLGLDDCREFMNNLEEPALAQAGVGEHLRAIVEEARALTWGAFDGLQEMFSTRRGARAGHPLGNLILNLLMSKVLRYAMRGHEAGRRFLRLTVRELGLRGVRNLLPSMPRACYITFTQMML